MGFGFLPPAIIEIKAIADKAIAEFGKVNDELAKIEGNADKAGKGVDHMAKASRIASAALMAAGTAVAGFAAYGVKAALEMETELTKLGQSMANVGLNTKQVKGEMLDSINAMEGLGFAGEDATAALTNLVQRTGDAEQSQKLLALSADLARAKGMTLQQASQTLAMGAMGSARAFRAFGVTLDSTLPKNEAIAKAMDELQKKVGGQAQAATKTFAVQVQILKNEFEDVAETVGRTLIPIMTGMIQKFREALAWAQKNKDMLLVVVKVVGALAIAIASYNITVRAVTAAQNIWNKAVTFGKSVLALFTKQQQAANTAMKANPIGLIVSAIMLLIPLLIAAWNRFDWLRKLIVEVGKFGVKAIGFIIDMVGKLAVGLIKIQTGPLKLLLKGLALLGVDGAKKALDGIENMTDGVGKFFDSAAKKVTSMASELDKLKDKKVKVGIDFKAEEIPDFDAADASGTGIKGMADTAKEKEAARKAAEKAREEKKKNNIKYREMLDGFQKEIVEAQKAYAEEQASITKEYDERVLKLKNTARDKEQKLRDNAAEKIDDATKAHNDRLLKIEQAYTDKKKAIHQRYNDAVGKINKKHDESLVKAALDNQRKIAEITKAGQAKLREIIQQSMDRLRDAFKTGTSFSVGELFKGLVESGTASADELLKQMKAKLEGARKLAANASMLAGMGFSQTFIEQVVAAGPEIGNQLADSLKNASPEALAELKNTYGALEEITSSGLNDLSKMLYEQNGFATPELAEAYKQAQADLQEALAEQARAYAEQLREINAEWNEALLEAARERDDALAEAKKDYDEALAESAKTLKEALAAIDKDLTDALAQLNQELSDALDEARKDFEDKMAEAKTKLAETLTAIETEYTEKFKNIKDATDKTKASVDALIASLAAARAQAAIPIAVASPSPSYVTSGGSPDAAYDRKTGGDGGAGGVSITFNNTQIRKPGEAVDATLSALKYGQVVTVGGVFE